jgi:hypothetical protein
MKTAYVAAAFLLACGGLMVLNACQTDEPGATYTLGSFSGNVDNSPDKVAAAAVKAANDMKLVDVVSNSTQVDGTVTAKDASGDTVTINISQAGDKVSKVTIRVGATGDESISRQLMDGINHHLNDLL